MDQDTGVRIGQCAVPNGPGGPGFDVRCSAKAEGCATTGPVAIGAMHKGMGHAAGSTWAPRMFSYGRCHVSLSVAHTPPPPLRPTARAVALLRVDPTRSSETGTLWGPVGTTNRRRERKGGVWGGEERGTRGAPPAEGEGSRKGQGEGARGPWAAPPQDMPCIRASCSPPPLSSHMHGHPPPPNHSYGSSK